MLTRVRNFLMRFFVLILVCTVGSAELGASANWLKTVYHLATESHEQWNPERENFPAGFQTGAHHHHASGDEDCGNPDHHSANFHLNELAGMVFVSLVPTVASAGFPLHPLSRDRFLIDAEQVPDQGHLSNLFRPPIA